MRKQKVMKAADLTNKAERKEHARILINGKQVFFAEPTGTIQLTVTDRENKICYLLSPTQLKGMAGKDIDVKAIDPKTKKPVDLTQTDKWSYGWH